MCSLDFNKGYVGVIRRFASKALSISRAQTRNPYTNSST